MVVHQLQLQVGDRFDVSLDCWGEDVSMVAIVERADWEDRT